MERGYNLYDNDGQAHLVLARRVLDSRTPGVFQLGGVWLPFPHVLMLPFVTHETWWRNGLAGAIPTAACFVLGGVFLFAGMRRCFGCTTVAFTAALVYALNPNLLYLQSLPMSEPVMLMSMMALFYFLVWFVQSGSLWAVVLAAAASNAASMTRYDGWFLIPFLTLLILFGSGKLRFWHSVLFGALASIGPLWWLGHNWWFYGDVRYFYEGPYSAKAIYQRQLDGGMARYPGDHDWDKAVQQFRAAAELCAGTGLFLMGLVGIIGALWKRAVVPLVLFLVPIGFYILSIHSSGNPIYVPHLWPNSYYNIRYGFAAYPLLVFGAAAIVAVVPVRARFMVAPVVLMIAIAPWIAYPQPDAWVVWKESKVNSEARRAWTHEAAEYLKAHYRPGAGIFTTLSDLAGIYREAGIPFTELLQEGNHPFWNATVARPDLFLWEEWAVAFAGDSVSTAIQHSGRRGPRFNCVKMISVKGAPVIEIYRREK